MPSPSKSQTPPLPSPRGYSDFFASGLRAVTNRARRASFTRRSIDVVHTSASYWTDRCPESPNSFVRRRHTSLVDQPDIVHDKAKKRRSALIALSARLFDRGSSSSAEESLSTSTASSGSRRSSKLSGSFHVVGGSEEEGVVLLSEGRAKIDTKTSASLRPLEPHSAPADISSHTITFPSDFVSSSHPGKRESFLSLNDSASSKSSFMLPPLPEHPESIHLDCMPAHSRRSSIELLPTPSPSKADFTWPSEDNDIHSPDNLKCHQPNVKEHWDAPANLDWHQFHTDILSDAE
ncbi:hypothetical protein CPB83DRAFT_858867 [Crepidotus variabilis]|uniref:Uncharacterized protein n=1 Tax=Crepidotus variabilis TaxID=179855 RepID=A0A9P6EB52_9AGAR|nr:hypothetical protein CPB83DRAFT_858867 [Crepidotus variabilis]